MNESLEASVLGLASRIDPPRAARHSVAFASLGADVEGTSESELTQARALGVLLATAYPSLAPLVRQEFEALVQMSRFGFEEARSIDTLAEAAEALAALQDEDFRRALRVFANREKLRIALRELLPSRWGGADVDVTAFELSLLADITLETALAEATRHLERKMGEVRSREGEPARFVVLGMGKLGGYELNAGSDVDLIFLYDSDDAEVTGDPTVSANEYFTAIARRLTRSIDEVTEDGFVWRVDLRLRPEGSAGPIVNSLAAAERYYEAFGRPWERAALLRARPVAGDLAFGEELLAVLSPFVWRRRVDPSIAGEMASLIARSRSELSKDGARDLKLGVGGIREAEFFAQTLQLIWGGRDTSLRARNTREALSRLESQGLSTALEASEIHDAYIVLRRTEHCVQWMTGIQTHALPASAEDLGILARNLGFDSSEAFLADLDAHRRRVHAHFLSLFPDGLEVSPHLRLSRAIESLSEGGAVVEVEHALAAHPAWGGGDEATRDLSRHLVKLAAHPDGLLGSRSRDAYPGLADTLFDCIFESADAVQAARYLRFFFERVQYPGVYVRLAFTDPAAIRRLVNVIGASALVGDALVNNPELGDMILFSREIPTPESAERELFALVAAVSADDDPDEALVGALRLGKTRVTIQTALADLAGELTLRQVCSVLSMVADTSLELAMRHVLRASRRSDEAEQAIARSGMAVLALGKLGSREVGYGSDLDLVFFYDPAAVAEDVDALAYFTRRARKVIQIVTMIHGAGPGYEIDVRLRPSGNQGLLVTSLGAFCKYHGVGDGEIAPDGRRAALWERMALTRSRYAAGDPVIGEKAERLAHEAVSAPGGTVETNPEVEIDRLRQRILVESANTRRGVHDLKFGRGGLLTIDFIAQFCQVRHGLPPVGDTSLALLALEARDILDSNDARALIDGYRFLRRLELRLRVSRADASHLLEEGSPYLSSLARRMDIRARPGKSPDERLLEVYRSICDRVEAVYRTVFGVA